MVVRSHPSVLYGKKHPVEIPAYSLSEAAHFLDLPISTVRSWLVGRKYPTESGERQFKPLILIADPALQQLSFRDLTELHVLSAIRRDHKIKLSAIRKAIAYLRKVFGSDHPLSNQQMLTDGSDLFIERYGELIAVSQDGQMALRQILEAYLERIERDQRGIPVRLYPFTRSQISDAPLSVVIDPTIGFGRPCLAGTGIPTAIVMERYKAGESVDDLASDYRRPSHEIEEAIRYESRVA